MKSSDNDPLELAEYFSIGTSIIGTIIANGIGQVIYAAMPITLTLFLNLVNRNRLKQQMQEDNVAEVNRLDRLRSEHTNITLAEVNRLEKLQKQTQKDNEIKISGLTTRIYNLENLHQKTQKNNDRAIFDVRERIQPIPEIFRRIENISNQLSYLSNNHSHLQEQTKQNIKLILHEIGIKIEKVPELIRQIDDINRRFGSFNSQLNRQDNMQMIEENRLQIESLKSEIKTLSTQKQTEKITRELTQLASSIDHKNELSDILQIRKELNSLENKLNNSSIFTKTTTISTELQAEIDGLRKELNLLKQKLNNQINVDISTLRNRLEPLILLTIQKIINQPINNLVNRSDLENTIDEGFKHKLIYDRTKSREILRKALEDAKERIIMVCPWITDFGVSDSVKIDITKALENNVVIDIGWGHLKDIEDLKRDGYICNPSDISETLQNHSNRTSLYNAVSQLTDLQKNYPNLNLKLLGTHEKFLVCDRSWALITSHNFLTSNDYNSEREIGLWTNDESIISQLIHRYDIATDLGTSV